MRDRSALTARTPVFFHFQKKKKVAQKLLSKKKRKSVYPQIASSTKDTSGKYRNNQLQFAQRSKILSEQVARC